MGNIALNKPTTASNSILPYTPSKAVNGSLSASNRWLTDQIPATLMVDTQARFLVNRWVVKHPSIISLPNNAWNSANYANVDYKLQGSNDNINWYDIDNVTNNVSTYTDRIVTPVAYRYFQVKITKGLKCNTQTASVVEFELYQITSTLLSGLSISQGTLNPVFNPGTDRYSATVEPTVASLGVTATTQDPQATLKINNAIVASGQPHNVNLNFGDTTITINVTDSLGSQKNYTLVVTRKGSCLSTLTVQTEGGVNVPLNPLFGSNIQAYTASVANNIEKVTFTPTAQKSSATITVNGVTVQSGQVTQQFPVVVGANTFNIVVTSDGASFPYTVTVTRAGSVNLLLDKAIVNYSGRTIQPGSVTVLMNATDTTYNTSPVPSGAGSATVTPFAFDATVVIKVNNAVVPSGNPSAAITLNTSGSTAVTILVTSADGTTSRSYTLNIVK